MSAVQRAVTGKASVTVTIPAKYVERFRGETLFGLGSAALTIQEISEWTSKAKARGETPKHRVDADDLERFHAAEVLYVEAHADTDGDLTVEAGARELHSASIGLLSDLTQELQGEAEKLEPDFDPVLEEFKFWRELRERLGEKVGD